MKRMSEPVLRGVSACSTDSSVNRTCRPLLEKRPVHPGESYTLKGAIKCELVWTFFDNQVHADWMRQKRAAKLAYDVGASKGTGGIGPAMQRDRS